MSAISLSLGRRPVRGVHAVPHLRHHQAGALLRNLQRRVPRLPGRVRARVEERRGRRGHPRLHRAGASRQE